MSARIELRQQTQSSSGPLNRLLWASPLAMAAAAAANLGLYAAAGALFPEVTAWPGAGIGQIIGSTMGYLFMGTIVFVLTARFSSRPGHLYQIIATIGLVLSLGLPISAGFGFGAPGAPAADVATVITLSLMHVVSYAISVPLFIRQALD